MLFGKIDFWFLTDIAYMEINWTEEEINLFSRIIRCTFKCRSYLFLKSVNSNKLRDNR